MVVNHLRKMVVALAAACVVGHVSAKPLESSCTRMTGGEISVEECALGSGGSYSLTNNSGIEIREFFVSTQADASNDYAWNYLGWGSAYISESEFNASGRFGNASNQFELMFGTEDTGAFHFWAGEGSGIASNTTTGHQFFFGSPPTSEFVAIGYDGQGQMQVFRSFNAPTTPTVPEPGTLALAGLALAGVMVNSRRRGARG